MTRRTARSVSGDVNALQIRLGRKLARRVSRVSDTAVDDNVELTRASGMYLRGTATSRIKPSLHTEGFGFVASAGAVMNGDRHKSLNVIAEYCPRILLSSFQTKLQVIGYVCNREIVGRTPR